MPFRSNSSPAPHSASGTTESLSRASSSSPSGSPRRANTFPGDRPTSPGVPAKSSEGFDFLASPGADEWRIGSTQDGRAVYTTVTGVKPAVIVEFQKFEW